MLSLLGHVAAIPVNGQIDPQPGKPAVPDPLPASVNPFIDSVRVTLSAQKNPDIFYDFSKDTAKLDQANAIHYGGEQIPIYGTGYLKTLAVYNDNNMAYENYAYVRDANPVVAFLTPTATTAKIGSTVSLSVSVTDADNSAPYSVSYSRLVGDTWTPMAAAPSAPPYKIDWVVDAAVGTATLRAIAMDSYQAADTALVNITIVANQAPTIAWDRPANNSSFLAPASFTLQVTPADADGAISKVEFYQNDTLLGADSDGAPWVWDRANLPEKTYAFKAVAYDNGPNIIATTSTVLTVFVSRNKAPAVAITFPENGKTYYSNFTAAVAATASDTDGKVVRVDFYIGTASTPDYSDQTPPSPFGYTKTFSANTYTLTAKAFDSTGLTTISEPVTFTVAVNQKPTARPGNDTAITLPANTVGLKGNASSDPEGTPLRYKWSGPAGVTFSNSDTIANPTANFPSGAAGTYKLKLNVLDAGTPVLPDSAFVTIIVQSKPAITSALSASGPSNTPFTYTLTATGYPTPTLGATGMPAWLIFNPANGTLSGTPTGGASNHTINLSAINAAGSDTKALAISIGDSLFKPKITSRLTDTAKAGSPYTYTITATGNPSAFSYGATGLPAGLTRTGGVISGTATATGSFPVSITVTNSQGSDTRTLNLVVLMDPVFTKNLPDSVPTVMDKGKASFSVTGLGYPAITYQWQFSANPATTGFVNVGTNAATYSIDSVSLSSAGWYRVILKNGVGPDAISKSCRLKVTPLPAPVKIAIGGHPSAASILIGTRHVFRVKATGEPIPLYFQWFKDGKSLGDPTLVDSLVIAAAAEVSAGTYKARVTNAGKDTVTAANFAWTDNAILTVTIPKLAKPSASPAGYSFYPQAKVVLTPPVAGALIYYTTSGAVPTADSAKFNLGDTIRLSSTRTIKAIAVAPKYLTSDVMSETYTYTEPGKVNKPVITPNSTTFPASIQCAISTTPTDAQIFYTKNGGHPSVGGIPYTGPFEVSATTVITAYAKKAGMVDSDTAQMTYTLQKGKSKVLTPEISPNGSTFNGTQKVTLFCATAGAIMRYTQDGAAPDSLSTPYNPVTGIVLTKSANLKVIGFLKDFENSDPASAVFKSGPGAITAVPAADIVFENEVLVRLLTTPVAAEIRYSVDNLATKDSPVFPAGGLQLTNTATISALAILDGVQGTVQSFSYTLKGGPLATPTPVTAGGTFTFKDTVHVTLYSTKDSKIYYTKDGSTPAFIDANLYNGDILLDATTTLQAIAVKPGFDNSKMLVATYTLIPDKPKISKTGGTYPLPIYVKLDCSSRNANIHWTLNGKDPTAASDLYIRGDSIPVKFSSTLKAVAIAGNMASAIAEETYTHFQVRDTVLKPGQTLYLEGNYSLRNGEDQQAQAQVRIADAGPLHLVGFDGVQFSLNLSLANLAANAGLEFPKLTFTTSPSEKRSLYKVEPSGLVYFITSADTVTLSQGGTYFLGVDISPPTIAYLSESYDGLDSTRVDFQVDDNVANLSYDLNRNDDPARSLSQQYLFSGQQVGSRNKHKAGVVRPLYVQLIVSDHQQAAFYPADPRTMLSLSQKLTPMQGPEAWKIGAYQQSLYDMVGIPMSLDPVLTLKDLRDLNPGVVIEGAEYSNVMGKFLPLPPDSGIKAGHGFWVGARSPIRSLKLPSAATLPRGSGIFTVFLRHGWNQISNPHLENMYWPFSRALGDVYKTFAIKGLWEWDPSLPKPDYVEADTLKPWRGYFVYNNLGDAEITLSPRPFGQGKSSSLLKPGAGVSMHMSLGWGTRGPLRLGADWTSQTSLGIEDELALPGRERLSLNAVRDGRALVSDWVRMEYAGVSTWKVAMGGSGDSLPPLKVGGQELPEGWEAWALAPSRGMKFRLETGHEVPASGLSQDTLTVVAGPKDKLAKLGLMQTLALAAPDLDLRVSAEPGGFQLRLALPTKARVRATLWTLDGRPQGSLVLGPLSGGAYRFGYTENFAGRPARLVPGMYFLSVEVKGQGVNARLARKLVLTR